MDTIRQTITNLVEAKIPSPVQPIYKEDLINVSKHHDVDKYLYTISFYRQLQLTLTDNSYSNILLSDYT